MPFVNQITKFINDELLAGSLNKAFLQPAKIIGVSTVVVRTKSGGLIKQQEQLPGIVDTSGKIDVIAPESKYAIQLYHKFQSIAYGNDKKGYGDETIITCSNEFLLIALLNLKLTGKNAAEIEPLLTFGLPSKISRELLDELGIISCQITPVSTSLDTQSIFRQEYPQNHFSLPPQMEMMQVRYRVNMKFNRSCVDLCSE